MITCIYKRKKNKTPESGHPPIGNLLQHVTQVRLVVRSYVIMSICVVLRKSFLGGEDGDVILLNLTTRGSASLHAIDALHRHFHHGTIGLWVMNREDPVEDVGENAGWNKDKSV